MDAANSKIFFSLQKRNDNLVMTPIWRLQNGQGPSWKYAQAKVESETNYQVLVRNM